MNTLPYKKRVVPLNQHSPYNLKSSQLMCLDYFLQYKEGSKYQLQKHMNIDEELLLVNFEKVFNDYTHVDVLLHTKSNKKILCEIKYTEKEFDILKVIKKEHITKYNGGYVKGKYVNYSSINKWMKSKEVTQSDFFNNYQLFRNLYNTFNDELGSPGIMYVIIPKFNKALDKQFTEFMSSLKDKYQFSYLDRIRKIYWEDLAATDYEFFHKYLWIK